MRLLRFLSSLGLAFAFAATGAGAATLSEIETFAESSGNIWSTQAVKAEDHSAEFRPYVATASQSFESQPVVGNNRRTTSDTVVSAFWEALGYEEALGVAITEKIAIFPTDATFLAVDHLREFFRLSANTVLDISLADGKAKSRFANVSFEDNGADNWMTEFNSHWCGGTGLAKMKAKDLEDATCAVPTAPSHKGTLPSKAQQSLYLW